MNAAQQALYWREFGAAWRARQTHGGAPRDRDAWRKGLHLRAGLVDRKGDPLSSTRLSNLALDRVLAIFRAYSRPADLAGQIALEEQPILRALTACAPLLDEIHMEESAREAYVAGIYRHVQRKRVAAGEPARELREMPDTDLGLILAALTHTVQHKLGVDHQHSQTGRGRARFGHQVGAKHHTQTTPVEPAPPAPAPARRNEEFDPANPF